MEEQQAKDGGLEEEEGMGVDQGSDPRTDGL